MRRVHDTNGCLIFDDALSPIIYFAAKRNAIDDGEVTSIFLFQLRVVHTRDLARLFRSRQSQKRFRERFFLPQNATSNNDAF